MQVPGKQKKPFTLWGCKVVQCQFRESWGGAVWELPPYRIGPLVKIPETAVVFNSHKAKKKKKICLNIVQAHPSL